MSKLTLEDAISHCLEVAEQNETQADKIGRQFIGSAMDKRATDCRECAADHRQLAEWLTELKDMREENKVLTSECDRLIKEKGELLSKVSGGDVLRICQLEEKLEKAKSMILDYSYTVEVMCIRIRSMIGCEGCVYHNGETRECKIGAYISRTRVFVKEGENDA